MRGGEAERAVARSYAVPLSTVQYWVTHAAGQRLDRVDWSDQPRGSRPAPNRTARALEDLILQVRQELREQSDLGEYGAAAIRRELAKQHAADVPLERTINRILERRGALDSRRRRRYPPPPRGWYLPTVADARAELDEFDLIEDLKIQDGPLVDVLTAVSLHGGLVNAWPHDEMTAKTVRNCMLEHWQVFGLPNYAQFDNDTLFQGPHQHPDAIGSVIRLCLSLEVVPVFVPVREWGFQAADENFNGKWQMKVWQRWHHADLAMLREHSAKYVAAHRQRTTARRERAPTRRALSRGWQLNLQAPPQGTLIFVRRTNDQGAATLLAHTFVIDSHWLNRLVRCEVDLNAHVIRCYGLRRRASAEQPLLTTIPYELPHRRFRE